MADRIIKADSGNDVIIQNNDASRKIEVTNSGDVEVTGDVKTTTVKATNLKANDGTASLEVADSTGDIGFSGNTNLKIKLPSSGGIFESDGSTPVMTEASGVVTMGSGVSGIVPSGSVISVAFSPDSTWLTNNKYLVADGSAVSRSTYADLFSAISTTWGSGDGSSTFNIPDLEGAFLRGTGSNGTHNMADGNDFAGPSVGSFENDQLQQFRMTVTDENGNSVGKDNGSTVSNQFATSGAGGTALLQTREFITHSFGTPRTGDETRPFNAGIKFLIKF